MALPPPHPCPSPPSTGARGARERTIVEESSMNRFQATHPSREQLVAFALGQMPEAGVLEIGEHLSECAACSGVAEHVGQDVFLGQLQRGLQAPAEPYFFL